VAWTRAGAYGIGVEINSEAVECARMNLSGTLVLRGKCHERLPQINEWLDYRGIGRRLLYTHPPRSGMEDSLVQWINEQYQPKRIAYLSCNAETLRRDLELMTAGGYHVVRIKPFDFFPRTHHIECLAFLER
jgi:23S rRNA (uracil1939-C5)-methyltransferase